MAEEEAEASKREYLLRGVAQRLRTELRKATNAEPETVTAEELALLKEPTYGEPVS